MYNHRQILSMVNDAIANIQYPTQPPGLYEPIRYVLSIGGKRIRPVFMLLASQAQSGNIKNIMPAAIGVETYHNYTLLHDDLMDRADMRRGMPTVHRKWDSNTAILSGDSMLVLALKYIHSANAHNVEEATDVFLKTALEIGEGQQYDMNFETRLDVTPSEYIEMIRLKTSVLIACSLKMGAMLAGADNKICEQLYDFGEQIGLAFQLQDDLLDVYGNPDIFGKRIGGDILCNKKTFLLISAFLHADNKQKERLTQLVNMTNFDEQQKIKEVTDIYNQLNIKDYTSENIARYFDKAKEIIDNIDLPQAGKQPIWDFARQLVNRNF